MKPLISIEFVRSFFVPVPSTWKTESIEWEWQDEVSRDVSPVYVPPFLAVIELKVPCALMLNCKIVRIAFSSGVILSCLNTEADVKVCVRQFNWVNFILQLSALVVTILVSRYFLWIYLEKKIWVTRISKGEVIVYLNECNPCPKLIAPKTFSYE